MQSGTAALALALGVVRSRAETCRCRVLLPAYGCPDLVAAVTHVGLEAVLVDTLPGEPFLEPAEVEKRLDTSVLAVVGAHFLGLAERIRGLVELARPHGVMVIEDSAQRLPGAGGIAPVADLVVLSFGRGKPAGALGGGALLVRSDTWDGSVLASLIGPDVRPKVPIGLQRLAYNALIGPLPYGAVARLPGLALGQTVYRPLEEIRRLDGARMRLAACQLAGAIAANPSWAQREIAAMLREFAGVTDLAAAGVLAKAAPLVRYPVLCPSKEIRDALHSALCRAGLGASVMYGCALPDLPGLPQLVADGVANARDFADRLLTLPVHSDVTDQDIEQMRGILAAHLRRPRDP